MATESEDAVRRKAARAEYRKKLLSHKELESRVRTVQISSCIHMGIYNLALKDLERGSYLVATILFAFAVKENLRSTKKEYAKTEDDLKSLQNVGQIIGEVLRPLTMNVLLSKPAVARDMWLSAGVKWTRRN